MKAIEEQRIKIQLEKILYLKKENLVDTDITLKLLIQCRNIMAKIIKEHGNEFLPIFIRIEKEIEQKKKDNHFKNKALQIAENV
ncbi:hypothetical protein [Flavivirga jejuensis]|uniref:Uncharacterized protein n=1 Tax=Flavivirga jejuensis TaxID=870487 RepID=A0ABT8WR50_9FLAO|nr:hypothetical protein [Flavivirga jejuensis]MDO5975606.1 hypothetical protein [Flavivirga jejuensis]